MTKNYVGIDVSKATLDASYLKEGKMVSHKFENDSKGFKLLAKEVPSDSIFVMEATGPYYLRLATFLYEHHFRVSVENPLKIKKYMDMNLRRAKTDKADSQIILRYGEQINPSEWTPPESWILELQQAFSTLDGYEKSLTAMSNQLEAFSQSTSLNTQVKTSLNKTVKSLKMEVKRLEKIIESRIKQENKPMYENIKSIPSIGTKTASMLMVVTQNFKKFETAKQLQAYIGFCPRVYQSGTSVKGRGAICKLGMSRLRKNLYMCTLSAISSNLQCKQMYERLRAVGKPAKVALVAVANKLIRQAFALAKGGMRYQENMGIKGEICLAN